MRGQMQDQPFTKVMDMLEYLADKHRLELDLSLINFASDIWARGHERGYEQGHEVGYEKGIRDESIHNHQQRS